MTVKTLIFMRESPHLEEMLKKIVRSTRFIPHPRSSVLLRIQPAPGRGEPRTSADTHRSCRHYRLSTLLKFLSLYCRCRGRVMRTRRYLHTVAVSPMSHSSSLSASLLLSRRTRFRLPCTTPSLTSLKVYSYFSHPSNSDLFSPSAPRGKLVRCVTFVS